MDDIGLGLPRGDGLRRGYPSPRSESGTSPDPSRPTPESEAPFLQSEIRDTVELSLESLEESTDWMGGLPSSQLYFDPEEEVLEGGLSYRELEEIRCQDLDFQHRLEGLSPELQRAADLLAAGFSEREIGWQLGATRHEVRRWKEALADHFRQDSAGG
ncbi:MAG: hypothetical protein HY319_17275 [Armatimonadetes bacterium]|nr:hypothetical protein [Armatimonadota bacterium]